MLTHSTVQENMTGLTDLRALTCVEFRITCALVMTRLPDMRKPVPDDDTWDLQRHGSA